MPSANNTTAASILPQRWPADAPTGGTATGAMAGQSANPAPPPDPLGANSDAEFRNIFENAPVGIFQSSATGLLRANPVLARMFEPMSYQGAAQTFIDRLVGSLRANQSKRP